MRFLLVALALVLPGRAAAQPQTFDVQDFKVLCDGSDQSANMAAAIAAVPLGGTLRNSCPTLVGLGPTDQTAALYFNKPIKLECTKGGGFRPLPSLGNHINVLYFVGSENGPDYLPTEISGCFIGDNSKPSRFGLHAVVFDMQAKGASFKNVHIVNSLIQQNENSPGRGILAINDARKNPVGGMHNATLCEDSYVYGGISLTGVGDSIVLRNCLNTGKHDVYVSLVNDARGKAGNFVIDGGPISNAGGLVIDCAASTQIVNVEGEQSAPTTNVGKALYYVAGNGCQVENVTIRGGQVQTDPGKGLTALIRVHNAVGTVIDDIRFGLPGGDGTAPVTSRPRPKAASTERAIGSSARRMRS